MEKGKGDRTMRFIDHKKGCPWQQGKAGITVCAPISNLADPECCKDNCAPYRFIERHEHLQIVYAREVTSFNLLAWAWSIIKINNRKDKLNNGRRIRTVKNSSGSSM